VIFGTWPMFQPARTQAGRLASSPSNEVLMSAFFTKSMARNIFYGGTLFTLLLFLALTFHTPGRCPARPPREPDGASGARQASVGNRTASVATPSWAKAPTSRRNWATSTRGRGIHQNLIKYRPGKACLAGGPCRSLISPTSNWMILWPS